MGEISNDTLKYNAKSVETLTDLSYLLVARI